MKVLAGALCLFWAAARAEVSGVEVDPFGDVAAPAAVEEASAAQAFEMEHAFALDGAFTARGTVDVLTRKYRTAKVNPQALVLEGADLAAFGALVATNGFYRVRVRTHATASNALGHGSWAVASLHACDLVTSGFKEEFKLLLAGGDGAAAPTSLLSVDYRVPSSHFAKQRDCQATWKAAAQAGRVAFASGASAGSATPAQALAVVPLDGSAANGRAAPPGTPPHLVQAFKGAKDPSTGKPLNPDDAAADAAAQPGFLRRYWYIILPLVILSMGSSPPPPDGAAPPRQAPAAS